MFCGEEEYSSPEMELSSTGSAIKRKNENKRRFSDEQIRSLETMFETDTKLEARQKLQLAKELGLQPRQVAIWFQNKRARWKSKQLEHDYTVLQNNYNSLASTFEVLKKENQSLMIQIQDLKEQLRNSQAGNSSWQEPEENRRDGDSGYREDRCYSEGKPRLSLENNIEGEIMSAKVEYFGFEEPAGLLADITESADGSLTSTDYWGNFDTDSLFDESRSSYQRWDFWS